MSLHQLNVCRLSVPLSLTPGFSRVSDRNVNFQAVSPASRPPCEKPLKRFPPSPAHHTRLKPGVNERMSLP